MSQPARTEGRSPQELFAEFLERVEAEPALTFERWVEGQAAHAAELRELHDSYRRLQPHLPESGAARGTGGSVGVSLERGYELLEELGRGGFGRVHRARDRVLQREVALKVLGEQARISPAMRRRFLEEARVLARLDHPNIVRIHSIESEAGEIRLCLELVLGRTLQVIVEEEGPFSPEEAARIGIDLCRALAAIHGQGLVHMDVKPGNVMRASGGRIVLLDFGFARPTRESGAGGSPLGGTPPFMSPEHFEGRTDIGPLSDVYSLGVLLYWLVSGRYPYEYKHLVDLSRKVLAGRTTPLLDVRPDVPAELVEIIGRAMAREESERFPSAGAMEEALRRFVGGGRAVREEEAKPRAPARRALLAAVGALGLLAAGWLATKSLARASFALDHGFYKDVDGEKVLLTSGDSVQVGDRLHMEARSEEAFYLYVFNQDEVGNWSRLLPAEEEARLHEKDVPHRFPPIDSWEVDIAGDREHLYVVASPRRVPFADELVRRIPMRGKNQNEIAYADQKTLRSIAGVPPVEALPGAPFDLAATFASFEQDAGPDVLTLHYDLRNDGQ